MSISYRPEQTEIHNNTDQIRIIWYHEKFVQTTPRNNTWLTTTNDESHCYTTLDGFIHKEYAV